MSKGIRISESEQYILDKLDNAGIDPFKTGMYFLMKRLRQHEMLIVIVVNNNEIVNIEEATKYDIAEAPENSEMVVSFPGHKYVAMLPGGNLHITFEKR